MEPRWQAKGRPSATHRAASSTSERNWFAAAFDGRCFQVRKWEAGVPEGTHTSKHHTEKQAFSISRHERDSCGMEGEMKLLVRFLQAISRELRGLWQAAGACLAIETYRTSTQSVGTCSKVAQNGNLHHSHSSKNGKIHLADSTAKVWLFSFQKLKADHTGYLHFIICSTGQSLNLVLLVKSFQLWRYFQLLLFPVPWSVS